MIEAITARRSTGQAAATKGVAAGMDLHSEWIRYTSGGTSVQGYIAWPARVDTPMPAILVIMEIWGVDAHMQDLVHRFATSGYLALAPDLYSHGGQRGPVLTSERIEAVKTFLDTVPPAVWQNPQEREAAVGALPEPQRRQVGETLGALLSPNRPVEQYTADLRAAVAYLSDHPLCRGQRIGSTGYCVGGMLSGRLACTSPELSAAVVYYGASPLAEQVGGIRCPILGFYGGDDPRITDGVPAFADAMRAAGKPFERHVYAGAPHAFFNDDRRSYRVGPARDAWARTLGFFAKHLGTPA